jgi:D-alanyl-D-alanine carboxypeptidase (penicillin-binding protein 5/6)
MASRYDSSDGLAQLNDLLRESPSGGARRSPAPVDPVRRRRRRRRGLIAGAIVTLVLVGLVGGYVGWALNAPVGAPEATTHRPDVTVPAAVTLAMPGADEGESAISVAGGDDYLGASAAGIWASSGGDVARPIASISKLITAMVVLNAKPLSSATDAGPTLSFDKADHDLYDKYYVLNATIAAMPTGSSMSEHDALETMLVVSACNYAEAVADWAFGSNAGFVSATRKWLAANGMTHTTMVEPTGIDDRNTSTPSDLIALGKLAAANPAVAAIVAKTSLDVPSLQGMPNTNDLLGSDGITGIKTGTLDASGSDLLFSATLEVGTKTPLSVIGVVLGGSSHGSVDDDVVALLHSITAGFHEVSLGTASQVVGTYSTPWGSSAKMVLGRAASVLTWSNTPVTSTMTTTRLTTGRDGERVGSVTWTAGKATVTVPVVLQGGIRQPTAWWRLTHPSQLGR